MKNLIISVLFVVLLCLPSGLHKIQPTLYQGSAKELNKQIVCLTSALYHESRSEPPEGIRAVATVIYNRTKHKNFPSDFCSVIKQPYQFSYLNGGKKPIKPTYKPSEHKVKATIDQLAFEVVQGPFKPILGTSVLYYTRKEIKRSWMKGLRKDATIGNHSFYRSKS